MKLNLNINKKKKYEGNLYLKILNGHSKKKTIKIFIKLEILFL
jgi:hypothetical protein